MMTQLRARLLRCDPTIMFCARADTPCTTPNRAGSESVVVVERELVDFAARVHNPTDYAYDRKDHARDQEHLAERDPYYRKRYARRGQQRQDRRPGKMNLLAGWRDLGIERAHER